MSVNYIIKKTTCGWSLLWSQNETPDISKISQIQLNITFPCTDPSHTSIIKTIDGKLIVFDQLLDVESKREIHPSFLHLYSFSLFESEMCPRKGWNPSTVLFMYNLTTCVDFIMNFSTHRVVMDKPSWGPTNREVIPKDLPLHWVCNNPRRFYLNFSKNQYFDDLGKEVMNILNLMCSDGLGRCVDAQRCL